MNEPDVPLPPHGRAPASSFLPCCRCGSPTPISVLNHLGARCTPCYERYVRESLPQIASKGKR